MFIPAKITLLQAIKKVYFEMWKNMKIDLMKKYHPISTATENGNMRKISKKTP